MLSSSLLSFLFIVLFTIRTRGDEIPSSKIHCQPSVLKQDRCTFGIIVSNGCNSSTLKLDDEKIPNTCSTVRLFWSYPMNNLTLIIEPSFTQPKYQPFTLHLHNSGLNNGIEHIYRRMNNQETEIKTTTTTNEKILVKSDFKHQVVLKFQGPLRMERYGVYIVYDIVKN